MLTTPHWILDPACPEAGEHQALVQWAGRMGGWGAPCWRQAETVLAEAAGASAPTDEP